MNNLKRIMISIKSQINTLVDDVENHEAQAESVLNDLITLEKNTRIQQHRLQKLREEYQQQADKQQSQIDLWSARAIKVRQQNENKAIQCVKRVRDYQQYMAQVNKQLQLASEQEQKTHHDLLLIQQQIQQLKNKKTILAARETRNQMPVDSTHQSNPLETMQHVLSRWEEHVISHEHERPDFEMKDTLDSEFNADEEALELKMMLDELTEKNTPSPFKDTGEH